jgi:tripartite-type tricarboxylate transporter receptor subunit TctC
LTSTTKFEEIRMKSLFTGARLQRALAVLLVALSVAGADAQEAYPAKPIRVIVPYPAGGVLDTFARVLTQAIARDWTQPLIVEPRPGASASLGTQLALQAKADGYTWLIGGSSLVANPLLFRSSTWNPPKDFAGVGIIAYAPLVLVVANTVPAKTLRELVDLAKSRPGTLNAGTMYGSTTQFMLESLKQTEQADVTMVPYTGAPPVLVDLVNGSVQLSVLPVMTAMPQIQSGQIRAIAIASPTRSPLMPTVPTFAEAGFASSALVPWYGVVVQRGTPAAVVHAINAEINEVLKSPELRDRLEKLGGTLPPVMTPADMDALIQSDFTRYGELIQRGHIAVQ